VLSHSVGDIDQLEHDLASAGYAVVRDVVSKARLASLADDLDVAYERADKFTGGGSISGHLNCFPGRSAAFAYDDLVEHGIVDAVHALRAGRPNDVRATMNYNLPGSVAQHYHIDGLYTDDFVICNVAVVDTAVLNGAIDVLPGTHREFLPYWKFAVQRTAQLSTRLELTQGDVLLRKSNLWHRGMPNRGSKARPMLSVTFGEKSAPQSDPFEGDIQFYANWYRTDRLGALRERVFVAAPISYSAYRFAKSLRGNKGYSSY
jgi:ectoine hydroxylase-related dioxygenase (phytanoyl-CoA dioxygenase family)